MITAKAYALRRQSQHPARQKVASASHRPGNMSRRRHGERPASDSPVRVDTSLHPRFGCRTLWIPAVLVIAHPLNPHGSSQSFGKQSRLSRRVVGAIVPITPGTFRPNHAYLLTRHVDKSGDGVPQRKRPLRSGPNRCRVGLDVGYTTRWSDRTVRLIWRHVCRLKSLRCMTEDVDCIPALTQFRIETWLLAHRFVHGPAVDPALRGGPFQSQRTRCPNGLKLLLAYHRDEVLLDDDIDQTGHISNTFGVCSGQRSPIYRRMNDACVHHAG